MRHPVHMEKSNILRCRLFPQCMSNVILALVFHSLSCLRARLFPDPRSRSMLHDTGDQPHSSSTSCAADDVSMQLLPNPSLQMIHTLFEYHIQTSCCPAGEIYNVFPTPVSSRTLNILLHHRSCSPTGVRRPSAYLEGASDRAPLEPFLLSAKLTAALHRRIPRNCVRMNRHMLEADSCSHE